VTDGGHGRLPLLLAGATEVADRFAAAGDVPTARRLSDSAIRPLAEAVSSLALARGAVTLERVRGGSMPCDGAWPRAWVELLARWVESGAAP
jgi:hypothetical protein